MRKIIVLISAVSFISTVNAQYLNSMKLGEGKTSSLSLYQDKAEENVKEPVLAGELSFILPGFGIGQMYNGQPGKAFVHIGITGLSFIIGLIGATNIHLDMGGSHTDDGGGFIVLLGSAALFTGNWMWSVVDAVVSANDINKKARLKKYRTQKNHEINFRIELDNNFRFKAALYF